MVRLLSAEVFASAAGLVGLQHAHARGAAALRRRVGQESDTTVAAEARAWRRRRLRESRAVLAVEGARPFPLNW